MHRNARAFTQCPSQEFTGRTYRSTPLSVQKARSEPGSCKSSPPTSNRFCPLKRPSAISRLKCFFIACCSRNQPQARSRWYHTLRACTEPHSHALSRRSVARRSSSLRRALLDQRLIAPSDVPLTGVGRVEVGYIAVVEQESRNGPVSTASTAICGALRQLIQSSPAGASSLVIRAAGTAVADQRHV